MPLWMSRQLAAQQICQTSFSKYGAAYQNILAEAQIQTDRNIQPYKAAFQNIMTNGGFQYA